MVGRATGALSILGAALAVALVSLRPRRVEVFGESMAPTLLEGDRLLAWCGARVRPGDLVVVTDPREPTRLLVKRVALGPDSSLRTGRGILETSGDEVLLLGDNPTDSTDGRTFGPLPRSAIRARVRYRYAPADRAGRP